MRTGSPVSPMTGGETLVRENGFIGILTGKVGAGTAPTPSWGEGI